MTAQHKPSSTSAATTAFCAAAIDGPGGHRLWIDGNGKITAGNGTLAEPTPNAFSLVHIEDCPGSTAACRASCYVHGLRQHASDTFTLYQHNSATIRKILADTELADKWAVVVGQWISEHCQGGFRWHVSGDVFRSDYAGWIVAVCRASPNVGHWIYTRSFDFVHELLRADNLVINLSADEDNWRAANALSAKTGLRICYMTRTGDIPLHMQNDFVIFPDYTLRGGTAAGEAWFAGLQPRQKRMVCPVDYHGKSEQRRCGPCDRCLK